MWILHHRSPSKMFGISDSKTDPQETRQKLQKHSRYYDYWEIQGQNSHSLDRGGFEFNLKITADSGLVLILSTASGVGGWGCGTSALDLFRTPIRGTIWNLKKGQLKGNWLAWWLQQWPMHYNIQRSSYVNLVCSYSVCSIISSFKCFKLKSRPYLTNCSFKTQNVRNTLTMLGSNLLKWAIPILGWPHVISLNKVPVEITVATNGALFH